MAISSSDISLVQESWAAYRQGDVVDQGVHMFVRIFERHPHMKPLWKIPAEHNSAEAYKKGPKFRYHLKRLFNTINLVVDGLDILEGIEENMQDLGVRHVKYGMKPEHFDIIGDGLLFAFETALGNKFTPEVKAAWGNVFAWLTRTMQAKLPENY